jgi:hypothetical protein
MRMVLRQKVTQRVIIALKKILFWCRGSQKCIWYLGSKLDVGRGAPGFRYYNSLCGLPFSAELFYYIFKTFDILYNSLGGRLSPSQGLYLHSTEGHAHTSMRGVGLKPINPVFKCPRPML